MTSKLPLYWLPYVRYGSEVEDSTHSAPYTSGRKHDADKPMMGLVPPDALIEVAGVLTYGAKEYGPHNWALGIEYSRLLDATLRHISAYQLGVNEDEDTGLHPLAHAVCELMFTISLDKRGMVSFDNIPTRRTKYGSNKR